MYAIVRIGGRQYRAEVGETITTEKLPFAVGETVEFDDVLLIADGKKTKVGTPTVSGAKVKAEVVDQFKGKKIVVFKYRQRTNYRRKYGHRQQYTRLQVNAISAGSKSSSKKKAEEAPAEESAEAQE